MRLFKTLGLLTTLSAVAVVAAHAQTAPTIPPLGTLTPPGSTMSVPLLPSPPTGGGIPFQPNISYTPPTYPGLGGQYGASAPGGGLDDVFGSASTLPLSLTLGQLTSSWRRMTITGSLDFGTITQVVSTFLGSAGIGVYYTRGQTVSLGNVTYLVTYRTQPRALNVADLLQTFQSAAATSKPPAAEKLTAQTPLTLTLLNLQSAGSLSDVRAFDLAREMADSAAAVKAYNDLISTFGTGGGTAPVTPPRVGRPKPRKTTQT